MMNLSEYIKEALLDITSGVEEARQNSEVCIAPGIVEGEKIVSPEYIAFEVMVTTSTEGSGGIKVLPIGLDGKIAHESYNKISFRVPVYFNAKNESYKKPK